MYNYHAKVFRRLKELLEQSPKIFAGLVEGGPGGGQLRLSLKRGMQIATPSSTALQTRHTLPAHSPPRGGFPGDAQAGAHTTRSTSPVTYAPRVHVGGNLEGANFD